MVLHSFIKDNKFDDLNTIKRDRRGRLMTCGEEETFKGIVKDMDFMTTIVREVIRKWKED